MNEVIKVSDLKSILRNKQLSNDAEIVMNVGGQTFDIKKFNLSVCDCCETPILTIDCEERE